MPARRAEATWNGTLKEGNGQFKSASGALDGAYSFHTRFEEKPGTNPEELIAAAHAACFSMALSAILERGGTPPTRVHTKASVRLEKVGEGFKITHIQLDTEAQVPGIDDAAFQKHASAAKTGCPVSQALSAVAIDLNAKLV